MSQVLVVSKDSPYTVQDALDKCAPGGRVAVLSGIHEGPFTITKPVHLMGHTVRGNLPILWADKLFSISLLATSDAVIEVNQSSEWDLSQDEGFQMEGFLILTGHPSRWQLFRRWLRHHFRFFR